MSKRLTTRGIRTAEAIRDREDFTTSGALRGKTVDGLGVWDSGYLSGPDLDRFRAECRNIVYVVFSYGTPIAWRNGVTGRWYKVTAKFSVTTTKHQGNLYLIETGDLGAGVL